MKNSVRISKMLLAAIAATVIVGCAGGERAMVPISYVVEPTKGLPPGMRAVAINDSKVNQVTDRKWSELAANQIQDRILAARNKYGIDIDVADRKHLSEGMTEQDLAAAGVTTTSSPGQGGRVMAIQGIIESEINVKVETHKGKQSTIANITGWGGRGRRGGNVSTREVDTISRNIVVQTTFKLIDTVNNRAWITYSPEPYSQSDKTKTFFLFGSSQTEAELAPRDEVIGAAVNKGVREFVSQMVPCEMQYTMVVDASSNKNSVQGVKMLRSESYTGALTQFKMAIADNPDDDKSVFGAGVACEAMGDFDQALKFYKRAYGIKAEQSYRNAKKRLSADIERIMKTEQA